MIFPVKNIQNFNLDIDYSVCENKYYSKSKPNQGSEIEENTAV